MAQWKKGAKKAEVEEVEVEEPAEEVVEEVEGEAEVIEDEPEVEEEPEPAPKVVKKVAKKAPVAEPEEVEEEVEVEEPKPAKKGKAAPAADKPKGAPRARKWVYGPIGENSSAKILMIKGATPPKGVADQAAYVKNGMLVSAFHAAGGDRHGLRVMLRQKFIVVRDGEVQYPRAWDPATDKQEPPKRKAKEEVEAVEEVEEAPAPKKVIKKAKK